MIDLTEVLHFEIKNVKKQIVVRFWVKPFLSTHQLNFQGSGRLCLPDPTARVLQCALESTVVPGEEQLLMRTKCYYFPDSLRHP